MTSFRNSGQMGFLICLKTISKSLDLYENSALQGKGNFLNREKEREGAASYLVDSCHDYKLGSFVVSCVPYLI